MKFLITDSAKQDSGYLPLLHQAVDESRRYENSDAILGSSVGLTLEGTAL